MKLDIPFKAYSWLHKKEVMIYAYHVNSNNLILDGNMDGAYMLFSFSELKINPEYEVTVEDNKIFVKKS